MSCTATSINQAQSLTSVRNFIRCAITHIAYVRSLCSEGSFAYKDIMGMKMRLLTPSEDSSALVDSIEIGAFDALSKGYLRELDFCIYNKSLTDVLESYVFLFEFSDDQSHATVKLKGGEQPISTGNFAALNPNHKPSRIGQCGPEEGRAILLKMLSQLTNFVDQLPPLEEDRVVGVRLLYHQDRTPKSYEPPGYSSAGAKMRQLYHKELRFHVPTTVSAATPHHFVGFSLRSAALAELRAQLFKHSTVNGNEEDQPTQLSSAVTAPITLPSTLPSSTGSRKRKRLNSKGRNHRTCRSSSPLDHESACSDAANANGSCDGASAVAAPKPSFVAACGDKNEVMSAAMLQTLPSFESIAKATAPYSYHVQAYLVFSLTVLCAAKDFPGGRGVLRWSDVERIIRQRTVFSFSNDWGLEVMKRLVREGLVLDKNSCDAAFTKQIQSKKELEPQNLRVLTWEVSTFPADLIRSVLQHSEVVILLDDQTKRNVDAYFRRQSREGSGLHCRRAKTIPNIGGRTSRRHPRLALP